MEAEAARAWDRAARSGPDGVELDCAVLAAEAQALARRTALRALETVSGGRFVGFDHAEALLAMVRGDAPGLSVDFPGVRAERLGTRVMLRPRSGPGRGRVEAVTEFCYSLSIPGEAHVAEAGVTVTADLAQVHGASGLDRILAGSGRRIAVVDSATLGRQLRVRSRQPGDRFKPLGLAGTKKLQDFFVDRKVAESERDKVPLVVDEKDRIVWVAGHAICEDFRVTAQTGAVVILRLESWGDRA
jgi:tRNA(Ile)-lysidine synthase